MLIYIIGIIVSFMLFYLNNKIAESNGDKIEILHAIGLSFLSWLMVFTLTIFMFVMLLSRWFTDSEIGRKINKKFKG